MNIQNEIPMNTYNVDLNLDIAEKSRRWTADLHSNILNILEIRNANKCNRNVCSFFNISPAY